MARGLSVIQSRERSQKKAAARADKSSNMRGAKNVQDRNTNDGAALAAKVQKKKAKEEAERKALEKEARKVKKKPKSKGPEPSLDELLATGLAGKKKKKKKASKK